MKKRSKLNYIPNISAPSLSHVCLDDKYSLHYRAHICKYTKNGLSSRIIFLAFDDRKRLSMCLVKKSAAKLHQTEAVDIGAKNAPESVKLFGLIKAAKQQQQRRTNENNNCS